MVGTGAIGLRTRRLRTALTASGIAIGIAALVAVLGISASGRADLLAQLDALGTNRLTVQAGQSFLGDQSKLPEDATAMIRRIGPVLAAAGTTGVDASVRRTDRIPRAETGGIGVVATEPELLAAVDGTVARPARSSTRPTRVPRRRARLEGRRTTRHPQPRRRPDSSTSAGTGSASSASSIPCRYYRTSTRRR